MIKCLKIKLNNVFIIADLPFCPLGTHPNGICRFDISLNVAK